MKKTILLIAIIAMALLLFPVLSFAQPENYLNSESSSYGLSVSKEMKQEAAKSQAREDRLLLYQAEMDELGSDSLELQAAQAVNNIDNTVEVVNDEIMADVTPCGADVGTGNIITNDDM